MSQSLFANGDTGPIGVYLNVNGSKSWYKVYTTSWSYTGCDGWKVNSGTTFSGANLGTVTTLKLSGMGVIGWSDNSDWIAGQVGWKVNNGESKYYKVGGYGSGCSKTNEQCSSGNDKVAGYKNTDTGSDQSVDILDGIAPGNHTLKITPYSQLRYNCGSWNDKTRSEVSASFTVPGFTKTTGSITFSEIKVGTTSDDVFSYTKHYGTALTKSNCSITGANSSEFEVKSIDETQVTVTFKPSSEGSKSATLTITDAHSKTCIIDLSGSATPSCTPPTVNAGPTGGITQTSAVLRGTFEGGSEVKGGECTFTCDGKTIPAVLNSGHLYSATVNGLDAGTEYTYTFNVPNSCGITSSDPETFTTLSNYYLKHPWDGSNWSWKEMTWVSGTTYTLQNVTWGDNGCNYNTKADDSGSSWVVKENIIGYNTVSKGAPVTFTFDSNSKTLSVTSNCTPPQASDFTVSGLTGKTYNGSNQAPTITAASGMGTMTVKYDGEPGSGKTNAGNYDVTVSVAAGSKFCASTDDIYLGNFVINKKAPTAADFTLTDIEKTYNGSAQKPTFTNAGDGTISHYQYSNNGGSSWTEYPDGPTNAGIYKVKVDVNAGNNYSAASNIELGQSFTINKADQATLTISNPTKEVCNGSDLTLTTSGGSGTGAVSYAVVSGGTGAGSIDGSTFTGTSAGTVLIKATKAGDDNYNEASSANATFTVKALNNVSDISFVPATIKKGDTTEATATVTTDGGTGAWSTTTGSLISFSSTSANPTTITANGIGTAKVTYTLQGGCSGTNSKTVDLVINSDCEAPDAGTINGAENICENGSVALTVTGYTATNTTLQWNKDGVAIQGATSATYNTGSLSATAVYTVTVTRTDVENCSATSDGATVTVTPLPTINSITGANRCGAGSVTLSATPSAGASVKWYDAESGGTLKSSDASYTFNAENSVTYYAEASIAAGSHTCLSNSRSGATATVKVIPSIGSVTATDDACGAGDITFTANNVTADSEVEWFENSSALGTGLTTTFSNVPAGTSHTVTAKATLNECVSAETDPVTGTRLAIPNLTTTPDGSEVNAYLWEAVNLTATTDPGATADVNISTAATKYEVKDITNGKALKAGNAGDTFTVTYVAEGTNGCQTQEVKTVTATKAEEICN